MPWGVNLFEDSEELHLVRRVLAKSTRRGVGRGVGAVARHADVQRVRAGRHAAERDEAVLRRAMLPQQLDVLLVARARPWCCDGIEPNAAAAICMIVNFHVALEGWLSGAAAQLAARRPAPLRVPLLLHTLCQGYSRCRNAARRRANT